MAGRIRKLRDMDIDEISLVDRAANQHASILFSKAQEDAMPGYDESVELYDTDGNPADFEQLDVGDVAYDDQGNEYVMVEDDGSDADYASEYQDEPDLVGKAYAVDASGRAVKLGSELVRSNAKRPKHLMTHQLKEGWRRKGAYGQGASLPYRTGGHVSRNRGRYGAAGLAAGTAGAGYGVSEAVDYAEGRKVRKSLGDILVEELSKSDQADRQLDMAGALGDEIEKAQQQAAAAIDYAEQLHEERALEAFVSKAAEYNLPVDAYVLGEILKSASQVLDREQLDVLDELFTAIGDDLYDELGAVGGGDNSDVLAQVDAYADELVGKSQGGISQAEASTMLFEANPEAYELYLQENGRY